MPSLSDEEGNRSILCGRCPLYPMREMFSLPYEGDDPSIHQPLYPRGRSPLYPMVKVTSYPLESVISPCTQVGPVPISRT
jgi:hypothetical protein